MKRGKRGKKRENKGKLIWGKEKEKIKEKRKREKEEETK